jgi:uncharacterized membrane protein
MSLNLAVTAAFAADFAWRVGADVSATGWGPLALSVVSVAVLAVSGALGGKLAYHYGVRVADEETQLAGFTSEPARTKVTNPRRVTRGAPRTR